MLISRLNVWTVTLGKRHAPHCNRFILSTISLTWNLKFNRHTGSSNIKQLETLTVARLRMKFHAYHARNPGVLTCSQCLSLGPILQFSLSCTNSLRTILRVSSALCVGFRNCKVSEKKNLHTFLSPYACFTPWPWYPPSDHPNNISCTAQLMKNFNMQLHSLVTFFLFSTMFSKILNTRYMFLR
jgi:hypothetical protein